MPSTIGERARFIPGDSVASDLGVSRGYLRAKKFVKIRGEREREQKRAKTAIKYDSIDEHVSFVLLYKRFYHKMGIFRNSYINLLNAVYLQFDLKIIVY